MVMSSEQPGPWFNTKISYQCRKSHWGDKTIFFLKTLPVEPSNHMDHQVNLWTKMVIKSERKVQRYIIEKKCWLFYFIYLFFFSEIAIEYSCQNIVLWDLIDDKSPQFRRWLEIFEWSNSDTFFHVTWHWTLLNSLAPGRFWWYIKGVIFMLILVIDDWCISCEIAIRWM